MMDMSVKIAPLGTTSSSGWLDITDALAQKGFSIEAQDFTSERRGRTLGRTMHLGKNGAVKSFRIKLHELTTEELTPILEIIRSEFFLLKYPDPDEGMIIQKTVFTEERPAMPIKKMPDGRLLWDEFEITLEER